MKNIKMLGGRSRYRLVSQTAACLAVAWCLIAGTGVFAAEGDGWAREFKTPPPAYKAMPLWWFTTAGRENTPAVRAEMLRQLTAFRDQCGYTGVAPLFGSSGYLTDDYWARYGFILETCRALGLKVILYDDAGFPSGSAGGRMQKRFPDDVVCRLDMLEEDVAGPCHWQRKLPAGACMGVVAMNHQTKERQDLSAMAKDGQVAWAVPAGAWKLMVFTCVRSGSFVDYLCPESVAKFFTLTYDEYFKRFPSFFGSTIIMTFYDDIAVRGLGGGWNTERRNWTPAFNQKFQQKRGFNPITLYPALWHDIGPDTEAARAALFGFRAELLAEGYPRMVHEWAHRHGLKSSGHAMGQYAEQPAFMAGDNILFYRHSDVPMMDSIGYGYGRSGHKLTSSAATSFDRALVAVEIYGNYSHTDTFTPELMARGCMELLARGANVVVPHGVWFNDKKVGVPPEVSHRNPLLTRSLPGYNDWVGRCSLLLRGGRPVVDLAVFYPIAALSAHARLNALVDQKVPGSVHPSHYVPKGCNLLELGTKLTGEIRRDFTFLHPEILRDRCVVKPGVLRLDNPTTWQEYKVVVLPYAKVIEVESLKKLQAFVDGGGKLIATAPAPYAEKGKRIPLDALPTKAAEIGRDREVVEAVRALFGCEPGQAPQTEPFTKRVNAAGGAVYFVPALTGLQAALADALPCADVAFSDAGPKVDGKKGMLSYLHKVKDGRNLYFIANSSDEPVAMALTLRGKRALEAWNPHDGSMAEVSASDVVQAGQACTRLRLSLDPLRTVFLVEKAGAQ